MLKKILILQLLSCSALNIHAQKNTWDYPFKPGTDKWKSYSSTIDLVKELQIPDDVLNSISTSELLTVCLNYPFFGTYTASNSPFQGMNSIVTSFNGFNEFISRKDAGTVLYQFYLNQSVSKVEEKKEDIDKSGYCFHYAGFELLLCNKDVLVKFSTEQQKEIFRLLMKRRKEKENYQNFYGEWGKITSVFAANTYANQIGKTTTNTDSHTETVKKLFADKMIITDKSVVDSVLNDLEIFLSNLK